MTLIHQSSSETRRPFVIGYGHAGFFSNFLSVMGHIDWCERNERTPAVYWGPSVVPHATHIGADRPPLWWERLRYARAAAWLRTVRSHVRIPYFWVEEGYEGARNGWEYYFEPVSNHPLSERPRTHNRWHYWDPDGAGIGWAMSETYRELVRRFAAPGWDGVCAEALCCGYGNIMGFNMENRNHPTPEYRQFVGSLIDRYVRLKPHVREKVEKFSVSHLDGHRTIAVHVRRTDIAGEYSIPSLASYWDRIDALPTADRIFLATDCESTLTAFRERYGGRLVSRDCIRSTGAEAVHARGRDPLKGEQVLIDVRLMARCDAFVHSNSNVSSSVLFWNPQLPSFFVPPQIEGGAS